MMGQDVGIAASSIVGGSPSCFVLKKKNANAESYALATAGALCCQAVTAASAAALLPPVGCLPRLSLSVHLQRQRQQWKRQQ